MVRIEELTSCLHEMNIPLPDFKGRVVLLVNNLLKCLNFFLIYVLPNCSPTRTE